METDYIINCTGDVVVGDEIQFEKAVFTGSFRKPKFSHNKIIRAKVIKDSYGAEKQQHTFTLLLPDGNKQLVKGRNVYRNGTFRKPWINESERNNRLEEKHMRGEKARICAAFRKGELNLTTW